MQKYLLKISRSAWILLIVIIVGFFFRDFRHHDFLRFNPDQARDAALIRDVIAGKAPIPLLGPQAGGTDFKLGGAFYQIEILSSKIFSLAPDRLAFPDFFFSILSIVLLYFFLREFFSKNISLSVTTIFAVSFYAVKYARFAWNPNSTPFYVLLFLFSILQLAKDEKGRKWLWALLIGVSAGIGVQLHSLLLFSMPIVFVVYFTYLFFKKNPTWKWAPFILLVGLAINTPQIISEVQTGGKNTQAFFQGMHAKSSRGGTVAQKLALDAVCHIQANSFMLLPIGSDSQCDFIDMPANLGKKSGSLSASVILLADIVFATIFSLGGYWLLFKYWREEKEENKKRFLELSALYAGTLFVLLIPLADEISFRFFLVLEFMPFLLLGFWLKYLQEKFSQKTAMVVIVAVIMAINCYSIARNFAYLAGNAKEGSNGFEEITLGEVEYMANFIETHGVGAKNVYLEGKASELFKITKPIQYFTDASGLEVNNLKKNQTVDPSDKIFSIDIVNDPAVKNSEPAGVVASGSFNRVRIYEIGK
jgi:hypothetical protein